MTTTKERPILFSAPMVRAILEGRKTVTRRAIKVQPHVDASGNFCVGSSNYGQDGYGKPMTKHFVNGCCPYGKPGDRLWVRETFIDLRGTGVEHRPDPDGPLQRYAYAADCRPGSHSDEARKDFGLKFKPSIHMPRAACRILLEITDVRVERLQDITYEQAAAEGVHRGPLREWCASDEGGACHNYPVPAFRDLWQSVGGNWDANPWVWVVEFKRVTP
ncbi:MULTISPECIES: hypothetical protein [unclassified Pseudomonas]|uniref:hypothetical protein n=1 Tax=unclassified Pseudomonas TaxID=196821 RepID=UPI00147451F2|nr:MULTISPECIES: hypothetical protein [unclassified Pseudomonas]NMX92049.1 hypothetical protein [Pseudomonas sp. WS 5086]NMY46869.1 hypothetical protein [Pseudomonas sp. WS 5027]